ncbi:hypothetical protein Tco_1481858 [Tanacetum coccineum]
MSDSEHSTITYTLISSDYEEPSDAGSLGVVVYGYEGLSMHPPSPEYVLGPEHPPSPDYLPGFERPPSPVYFNPEEDPEEDDEDSKEDPADYPADRDEEEEEEEESSKERGEGGGST